MVIFVNGFFHLQKNVAVDERWEKGENGTFAERKALSDRR